MYNRLSGRRILCDFEKAFDCAEIQLMLFKIVCRAIYLDPGGMNLQGTGGDGTLGRAMNRTSWQMFFWRAYQEE